MAREVVKNSKFARQVISNDEAKKQKILVTIGDNVTGELSIAGYNALQGGYLNKYAPVDDNEKKVIDKFLNQVIEIPIADEKTIKLKYSTVLDIDNFVDGKTGQASVDKKINSLAADFGTSWDDYVKAKNGGTLSDEQKQFGDAKYYLGVKLLQKKYESSTEKPNAIETYVGQPLERFVRGVVGQWNKAKTIAFDGQLGLDGGEALNDYTNAYNYFADYYSKNPDELGFALQGVGVSGTDVPQSDYIRDIKADIATGKYENSPKWTQFISKMGFGTAGEMLGASTIANFIGLPTVTANVGNKVSSLAAGTKVGKAIDNAMSITPKIKNVASSGIAGKATNKIIDAINTVSPKGVAKFLNPLDNPTTTIMGATSAYDKYRYLRSIGYSKEDATANALYTGYVNAITEKMGYNGKTNPFKMLSGSKKKNLGSILKLAHKTNIAEGVEEIYATVFERAGDFFSKLGYEDENGDLQLRPFFGDNGVIDLKAIGESFLGGYIGGAVMGSVGVVSSIVNSDIESVRKYADDIKNVTEQVIADVKNVAEEAGVENVEFPDAPNWKTASVDEIMTYAEGVTEACSEIVNDERVIEHDANIIQNATENIVSDATPTFIDEHSELMDTEMPTVSMGESFHDTKTGNTITIISRDDSNTVVEINTGTKTESRTYTNKQADRLAVSDQYTPIERNETPETVDVPETVEVSESAGVSTETSTPAISDITLTKVGDFYEAYGDEAIELANKLGLTLATKNVNGTSVQMVGFPVSSLENYSNILGNNYNIKFADANSVTGTKEQNMHVIDENTGKKAPVTNTDVNKGKALPEDFRRDEDGKIRFNQLDIDYTDTKMRKGQFKRINHLRKDTKAEVVDGFVCGAYGVHKNNNTDKFDVSLLPVGLLVQNFSTMTEAKKCAQYLAENTTLIDFTFYAGISGDLYMSKTEEIKALLSEISKILTNKEYVNSTAESTEIQNGKVPFRTKAGLVEYIKTHKGDKVRVSFNNGESEIRTLESANSTSLRTKTTDGSIRYSELKGIEYNDTGFSIDYSTGVSVSYDFVNVNDSTTDDSVDEKVNETVDKVEKSVDDSDNAVENTPSNDNTADVDNDNTPVETETDNANISLTEKCELIATKHTETGDNLWVVTLKDKLSKEEYKDLNAKVKAVGGYYSRFAKTPEGKAIPGFVFKTEPTNTELKVFNDFFASETAENEVDINDKVYELVKKARMADPVDTKSLEEIRDYYGYDLYSESLDRVIAEMQADELIGKAKELQTLMEDDNIPTEALKNQSESDTMVSKKTKDDFMVGDILEFDGEQWKCVNIDSTMIDFENVNKNAFQPELSVLLPYELFKEKTDYTVIKEGAENDKSKSSVLERESESDGRGLRTGAAEIGAESTAQSDNGPHREVSGEVLSQSDGESADRPTSGNDGERVNGTSDAGDVKSEAIGESAEITDTTPETIDTVDKSIEKKRPSNKGNFVITDDIAVEFDTTAPSAKDNIEAIELLLTLENEGRAATAEEKKILAKYKGWGGIDTRRIPWELSRKLYDLYDGQQLREMQSSQNNAFFTPTKVIDAMYNGLKRMGFKGGNVLETSMGVGNFFGRMPSVMSAKSALTGVELESYTARIAQYLYPGATVINKPFQDVAIKNGSYDLVIGNVPFGTNKISYNKKKYALHNYFIISSLDKVKDGGVVAVITSAGTLDSYTLDARKAIMDRADVVACYKLPEKVFSRNASTDVQTDLLILRKRAADAKPSGDSILNVTTTDDGLRLNEYFVKHPENVLGTLAKGTNAWGEVTTVLDTGDFYDKLNAAMKKLPKDLISGKIDLKPIETIVSTESRPRFFEKNGKVYADDGAGTATQVTTRVQTVRDYMAVRDAYKELLTAYENDLSESEIKPLREALSEAYDTFYKNHTAITGDGKKKIGKTKCKNNTFLEADADYYLVSGLESYDSKNGKFVKSALFKKDTLRKKKVTSVNVASDALAVSLNETGRIDFARMQELTGKTEKQLADELKGEIVLTPEGDYVLTDIYLSGNIYEKLDAVKGKPEFKEQQEMLEKVIPTPKDASAITVKLGANYIDTRYIEQFARDIFNTRIEVKKDVSGKWIIEGVRQSRYGDILNVKYGCKAFNAIQLLEKILNDAEITATVKTTVGGKTVSVIDPEMTDIARQKAEDIKAAFESWIFSDSDRRTEIVNKYNRTYNNYRPLDYERIAEKLSFDSMDSALKAKLYPHQKKGIARFLFGGNILFAHGVGTGKTFEMIASVMEAKRMGLINKAAMVVPNNKVVDFKSDIAQAYPNAKVLVIDTANKKRQTMLGLVNSNDWDIVLIARTTFTKIPVSAELQANYINQQLEDLEHQIAMAQSDRDVTKRQLKGLITQRDNLEQKLKDLSSDTKRDENSVDFEKLGIDCICVDEAHNYKSILTPTKLDIKGLVNRSNAQMANDMLMKLDYMRSIDGKIIFGTGTPITNTVSEIYNMMRMVRPDILEAAGIRSLDEWVNTFAKIESTTEIGIDNQIKSKSTQIIRSFINVSEMIGMFRQFADIVFTEDVVKNLPKAVYKDVELEGTDEHRQIEQQISDTIAKTAKSDLLKVYGQVMAMADAASVDLRMLSGAESEHNIFKDYSLDELDYADSKINTMCDIVIEKYKESADIKGTQIIFCDKGSGSGTVYSFNLHKDIMQKLIDKGIPKEQVVIIKDQSDAQLEALYEKVNAGEVRVIIGTSQKMAEGLNVQKRVVAIHHPTVTYKPSDWEQGNARGVRAGNINSEVEIYRYLQKNTFDSHKWQAQDRKGEMIRKALRGEAVSEMEDIGADDNGGAGVDAATAMAITSGNPLVKEKIDIDKEVMRLKTLRQNYLSERYKYEDALAKNPSMIRQLTKFAENLAEDIALKNKYGEKVVMTIKGKTYEKQSDANKALAEAIKAAPKNGQYTKLGEYNGFDIMFKGDTGGMNYSLIVKGANEYSVEYAGAGNNMARIGGVLNRLTAEQERVLKRIDTLTNDLAFAEQEIKKPFEKESDLAEALEKQKDITYRYEHYSENKADTGETAEGVDDKTEYSLESEDLYNGQETDVLHNGSREWNASEYYSGQVAGLDRATENGQETYRERKAFIGGLTSNQVSEQQRVDERGTRHKFMEINKTAWNTEMLDMATYYENKGVSVHFIKGNVEFAFEGKKFTARAMRVGNDIYLSYDNPKYTPQQLAMHEYLHTAYNTPEVESAKKKVLDSMSRKEYNKAINELKSIYKNVSSAPEVLEQELVCNVLSGMYNLSDNYNDIIDSFWLNQATPVQHFDVSQYARSTDAGGQNETILDNIGLGSEYQLEEGGEVNERKDTKALGKDGTGKDNNSIWKRSVGAENSYERLEGYNGNKRVSLENWRGHVDWGRELQSLSSTEPREAKRAYGILREVSKRRINAVDSDGRFISNEVRNYFKDSVFKNNNGDIVPLFHATDNDFDVYERGEFGFHIGTAEQAIKRGGAYIKELYVNITNPMYISEDRGSWTCFVVANEAVSQGIISQKEYNELSKRNDFHMREYNAESNVLLRTLLASKGYDGIVYLNDFEGEGISAIAFEPNQLKYVANTAPSESPNLNYSLDTAETDTEELTPERKKEIFEQFEQARVGIDKPTQRQLWGERAAWVAHNATRVFPNIPERGERGTFFAEFRKSMIQWKNLPTTASFMAQDKLNKMTEGLTPEEFRTFSELVYFLDLQEEAQIQKERGFAEILLPNEISPDEVNAIVRVLNEEATENVQQALAKRREIWDTLKSQYTELNRYIGFDTDGKFQRKNYYHHQVIDYMNSDSKGTGSRDISIKAGRGWLKERQGSTKAINTDFLAVEYKAMLQMQYDIYIAETLGRIKKQYDIKPQLEKQAFANNKKLLNDLIIEEAKGEDGEVRYDIKGNPDSEIYKQQKWYNQRIMFGFSGLFDLAENNDLPTFDGAYSAVVDALKNHDLNVAGLYKYVGMLANTDNIENLTDEQEQAAISARTVLKYTSQKKAWIRETLGENYQTWETIAESMSDTHSIHQPRRGNYFYTKTVVDEEIFNRAFNEMVINLATGDGGIETSDEAKKLFAQYSDTIRLMGAAFEQWVLPNEIVETMSDIANPKQAHRLLNVPRSIVSAWKGWSTSINPLRTVKFGVRNLVGDLDAVIAGNPRVVMYSKKAAQEIYQAMRYKNYSPEFMEWVERGGYASMIFANEMDSEMQDKLFSHLKDKQGVDIFKVPAKVFEKYRNGVENAHNFREAILRYSSYLYFKEAINRNGGNVKDYVASNKYIVRGLNTVEDKAYQLSKDLLGAYDEVGKMGQTLRRYWIPFYSFTETNMKRYYRMFENIITSEDAIPKKAGKLLLKGLMVNMLSLLMVAWNKLVMDDEEEKLPPSVRNVPHLTLGKVGDNIYAFRQLGSFAEILEWFGLEDYKWTEEDLMAPLDKAWGMVTPFLKLPIELRSKLNFYPSLSKPRAIRDRWQHFFNSFGVDNLYNEITGKPTRGLGEIAKGSIVYNYDYKESAYYEILDIKREYQGKTDNTIYGTDAKSNALYYMKTAVRYKDEDAALKYLDEYFENGGTVKGIKQSFATLNPMYGYTGKDTIEKGKAFIKSLTSDEREKLLIAQDYYENDLMLPENVLDKLGRKGITDEEAKNVLKGYIRAKCK